MNRNEQQIMDTDQHEINRDDDMNFTITPWEVSGSLDDDSLYIKLIKKFGTQSIDDLLIDRIQEITGEIHPLLKQRYFFSHRDLGLILDKYQRGEKFYLYTGRGPSGMVHLGHILPWIFTKYLQEKFDVKLLFQITDDEKFLYNINLSREQIKKFTYENILDIIAVGFKPELTKIIIDTIHIKHLYPIALDISRKITFSTAKAAFGFSNNTNIGMIGFPPIQASPCFLPSVLENKPTPVLIPAAIDQDPYWRITRDVAEKLGYYKPAQIHSKFLPSLTMNSKMSSSKPDDAVLTTDEPEVVVKKIKSSLTGGQPTVAIQRELGGNPSKCPVFWYLKYFFDSEKKSNERFYRCTSGNLLCGECKNNLADNSKDFIIEFKKNRERAKNVISDFIFGDKSDEVESIQNA